MRYQATWTTYEALTSAIGPAWAASLWRVVRDDPGLADTVAERLLPRWRVRLRGDGTTDVVDANAADRAAWITRMTARASS